MIQLETFTFNPFQENTYVLWDETNECVIVDPGCYDASEQIRLSSFITDRGLTPVLLVNTHCHIDHIFGNAYCKNKFDIPLVYHKLDHVVLESGKNSAMLYGLHYDESPSADKYLVEGEKLEFGASSMDIVFTPGHSPGSVCLIAREEQFVIGGDVLFQLSIGRTDLPGGDHQTLLDSIQRELFVLPESMEVYPGHGPKTTIGFEKENNPFLQGL
ncbi:MAG: MBL fold metallo-hydrolase [Bacteroidia bacterium]|nr:MBL fold metallo-hydrolase [Bacteroidia bacterium]